MKIVFSRKGVDSQAGKLFSAIINERLVSIPIPAGEGDKSKTRYRDLTIDGVSLGRLVEELSIRRNKKDRRCADELLHFDPDLRRESLKRKPGWRPLLGLGSKEAQRIAQNGVGKGDLFLFFGPLRAVQKDWAGRYRYAGPKQHLIHGWLQISGVLKARPSRRTTVPEWMRYHPHFLNDFGEQNTVYVATQRLSLPGLRLRLPGGGSFERRDLKLCLTAPGGSMSYWRLPFTVRPHDGKYPMSRFETEHRWTPGRKCTFLDTNIGYWQDEVLDSSKCRGAVDWLVHLFDDNRISVSNPTRLPRIGLVRLGGPRRSPAR